MLVRVPPEGSAHDALQVLIDDSWRGRRWVVETDIANCFEAITRDEWLVTRNVVLTVVWVGVIWVAMFFAAVLIGGAVAHLRSRRRAD